MLRRTERILENIPVGSLGLIALTGCEELGKKVDDYLVKWRHESGNEHRDDIAFAGYEKDTFLVNAEVPRFGSGEAAFWFRRGKRHHLRVCPRKRSLRDGRCLQLQCNLFSDRKHESYVA